jgi:hypothetical protein|eukprot:3205224-Prymnesium_polylepis.1
MAAIDREGPLSSCGASASPVATFGRVGIVVRFDAAIDQLQLTTFNLQPAEEAQIREVRVGCSTFQREQGLQRDLRTDGRTALACDPQL